MRNNKVVRGFLTIFMLSLVAFFVFGFTMKNLGVHADMQGTGTSSDPYQISTKAELEKFRDIVNGSNGETKNLSVCGKLTADIDLNNEEWTPIGNTLSNEYAGTFNGNTKTIKGLAISGTNNSVGLFGRIYGATIKNLTVEGSVSGGTSVGGIVGYAHAYNPNFATITGCISNVTVTGASRVGGFVGEASQCNVSNCRNIGDITGTGNDNVGGTGGIVGIIDNSTSNVTVSKCFNTGKIVSVYQAGGIVGLNSSNASSHNWMITNCYNTGDIEASVGRAGGITGYNNGKVVNCHNVGKVITPNTGKDAEYAGGIIGLFLNSDAYAPINCFYLKGCVQNKTDCVGKKYQGLSDPISVVGNPLSASSFKDSASFYQWDFTDVWMMGTDYPVFIPHKHKLTYEVNGATITATCSDEGCPLDNNQATLTLVAPKNLVYSGSAKVVTFKNGYDTSVFANPTVKYYKGDVEVQSCIEIGTYVAKVTYGGVTAELEFTITPHTHDDIEFKAWTSTNSLPTENGNYFLANDITLSRTWNVPSGTTNLCLNGHRIKITGSTRAIDLYEATLKLFDCDDTTEHKYTISNPVQGAGLAVVNDDATGDDVKTFVGGYITGANTSDKGAVIYIEGGGRFVLNGGTIIGNTTSAGHGGGAIALIGWNENNQFIMNGGALIGNTTSAGWGGAVYLHEDASVTMNGGVIKENYASKSGGEGAGGGISAEGNGKLIITGGAIINNVAENHGGNINFANNIQLSGNVTITGGKIKSGEENNIYINENRVLNIVGELDKKSSIHFTTSNVVFTSGWSKYMLNEHPEDYFVSDVIGKYIGLKDGEVALFDTPQRVRISGNSYSNMIDAYQAYKSNDVIVLMKDYDPTDDYGFVYDKNIEIDLNGYVFTDLKRYIVDITENHYVIINNSRPETGGIKGALDFNVTGNVLLRNARLDITKDRLENGHIKIDDNYKVKNIKADGSADENGFIIITHEYKALDPNGKPTVSNPNHTPVYIGEEITIDVDGTPVEINWYYVDCEGKPTGDPIGTGKTYTPKSPDDLGKKIVAVIKQTIDEDENPITENIPTQTSDPIEIFTPFDKDEEIDIIAPGTTAKAGDELEVSPSFNPSTVKWYYDDDEDGKPDSTTPIGEGTTYTVVCPDPNDENHDDTGHTIIAVISQDVDENGNPITTNIPTITTKGVKVYTSLDTTIETSINTPNHDPLLEGDEISVDSDASEVTFEWFYTDEEGNPTGEPIGTEKTYTIKNPNDLGKKIIAVITQNKKPDGIDYADDEKPKQYSNVVTVYKPLDTNPLNKPEIEGLGEKPKAENGDELEVNVDYNPVEIKWYYDDNNDGQPDDPTKPLGTGNKYTVKSPDSKDENHDDTGHTIIAVIIQPTKPNGDSYEEGKAPTQSSKPVVVKGVIGGFIPLTPEQEITEETPDHTPLYVGDEITVDVSSNPINVEWFYTDEEGNPTGNPIGEGNKYTVKSDDLGKKIIPVITQNKNEDGDDLPEENWVVVNADPIEIYKAFDEETDVTTSSPVRMPLEVGDEIEVTVDANPITIKWYYDDNEDGIPDNLDNPLGEGNKYTVKEEDKEHAIVAVVTQDKKPDGNDYADDEKPRRNNSLIAIEGYEHIHNFTYEDFDNQIMAKCTELCNITEGLVLTLKAPSDLEYDGKAKAITFEEDYSKVAFDNIVVKYYKNDIEVEAAIDLGTYVTKVTFGDATAEIEFEIVKGAPVVNLPKGLTLEVGQKLKDVTLPSGFAWENPEQVVNSTGTQKFTAKYTPTDTTKYNDVIVEIEVTPTWNIEPTDIEDVEVEIKNPEGVALDDKVSVKVEVKTNVKATVEKKTYNNIEKDYVENGKEISFVYSVKLVRTVVKDGVEVQEEIQPSDIKEGTTIVITMNVPEKLKGQSFRVLHIHNDQDISYVDYKLSDDGNTITVEINRLSEFAFVSTKGAHGFCIGYIVLIFAIIAVIWLLVYVLAYFELVDKLANAFETKLDLIGLISLCASGAIFLFALIALILHVCAVTIVSFILAFIVCAIFLILFLLKKFKKNRKSLASQRKANAKKETKEDSKEETLVEETEEKVEETKAIEAEEEAKPQEEIKEESSNENREDEEEFEDEEEDVVVKDETGHFFKLMYNKSFTAKLIQTDDDIKNYYQELKNYVLSYKGTVSRMSWGNDSINKGRTNILKFSFKRKNLYLYLALNADEYADSKYRLTKVETKKYQSVPSLFAVKNSRNLQYAKELIDIICQKLELVKAEDKNDNYILPYEETSVLLEKGLIKEVKKALADKKEVKVKTRKEVSESEVNSLMSNETASFLIVDERKGPRSGKKGIVNIVDLERCFNDGDTVNIETLKEKKLIPNNVMQVKLLSHGKLDKKLNVELQDFSIEAAKMIILTGGTVKRV